MTSLACEEMALPALSVAEVAYVLSQRLSLSLTRMLVRNESCAALLQLDTDACLHLNHVYAPDARPEFLFFARELVSALHEWRVRSEYPFDVCATMRPSMPVSSVALPSWEVHIGVVPCTLPRHGVSTSEAMLDSCVAALRALDTCAPFCISKIILDTSSINYTTDMRAVFDLHQLIVPLMVHWLLQSDACDARPLMLGVYVPGTTGCEALLMRLYVHRRTVTETRLKRRKLAASGFNDTMYIAVTPCAALEVALRQRLNKSTHAA